MKFSSTKVDKYVSKFAIWFPNSQWYWLLRSTQFANELCNVVQLRHVKSTVITPTCPYRICYETWEITYQSQLCVNKHVSQALYQTLKTTKMKFEKLLG